MSSENSQTAAGIEKPPRAWTHGAVGRSLRPAVGQGRRSQRLGALAGLAAAQSLRRFGRNGLACPYRVLSHHFTSFRQAVKRTEAKRQALRENYNAIPRRSQ